MINVFRWVNHLFGCKKNAKWKYFFVSYIQVSMPHFILKYLWQRDKKVLLDRADQDYIWNRVNYYNRLAIETPIDKTVFRENSTMLGTQKIKHPKVYYLDSYRYAKAFSPYYRWIILPGDVTYVPKLPSIVKSRPIVKGNQNAVLMKLDRVRHFLFIQDKKAFQDKKNMAIFRGEIGQKEGNDLKQNRLEFMQKYFQHPLIDAGVVDEQFEEWHTPKLSIAEHLNYKFIMALEGNDVASNLKWIMSSNSIAVMPPPTCESWFMEGKLIPNYHYIAIKTDFSDLPQQLRYYINHPEDAEAIVEHAHQFVAQFKDKRRERMVSLLVLQKYLNIVNDAH